MVFKVTFNNISIISLRSVLLVEGTGVHGENHQPVACYIFGINECLKRICQGAKLSL